MAQRTTIRPDVALHGAPPRISTRSRRGRSTIKKAALLALIVAGVLAGVRICAVSVYGGALRREARTIPARVHDQLARAGAVYVPAGDISPYLRQAIVAIEDRRFYRHSGIDPQAIVRAFIVNLQSQQIDQGGSTLEEQLAKRAIVQSTDTIHDKLRIMALAWAIDQDFSKPYVLELYLNDAYFGQGAYGAAAASRIYFGTDAAHLSIAQAAFLAALPQAPSVYGAHPTAAAVIDRMRTVLDDMRQQGNITLAQERAASDRPLDFVLPNP